MPVPEQPQQTPQPPTQPDGRPSQKSMTKAERRELQEKQRAAKAAAKAQPQGGAASKTKAQPAQKKASEAGPTKQAVSTSKDALGHAIAEHPTAGKRGPRIFTHFGLPKPIGHTVKGDIHPAVVRLGLLFSEFKICGANARCIATLTAFKNVRSGAPFSKHDL